MFALKLTLFSVLACAAFALPVVPSPVLAQERPALIEVEPEQVFAPSGFDDNDTAQVVLRGVFPDACYKVAPARVAIDSKKQRIVITAQAYHYKNSVCLQVRTPWVQAVDLGILTSGHYRVVTQMARRGARERATLPVSVASGRSPDDFDYARVTDAVVRGLPRAGAPELTLHGTFHVSCLQIREVRTIDQADHVIEVLPIVEVDTNRPCSYPLLPIDFEQTVRLDRKWSGPVLIHVRSVEGMAVNRVVEFP